MKQMRRKTLCILKHVSEISHSKLFLAELLVLVAITSPLIVHIRYNMSKNPSLLGDDTAKLIEDFKDMDKHQIPISSWMDRVYVINGSNYTKTLLDNLDMIDIIFFSVFNIKNIIYLAGQVAFRIVYDHPYFILASCKKKFGAKNLCLFFLASTFLCTIYSVGMISFFELILQPFKDTFNWIDSRVYDTTFALNIDRSSRLPHPFTMGLSAPFFLFRYHRYLMEDIVFTCEFVTYDQNFIYKRTQWRKNGSPLKITNDRIFVNVSIYGHTDHEGNGVFFTVLSKLTIQLLQESDFGSYTCEYQVLPNFIVIMPGPSMSQEFTQTSDKKSQPMSPGPECPCKPKEKNVETGQPKSNRQTSAKKFQCFAEFILLKREERVFTKSINPGSIVISSAYYSTISGSDDVEFEISSKEDDNDCCSKFIKIYWYLFRGGRYFTEPLPFTRIIHDENGLYFHHYQCMCKSSFGMQEFRIHRKYFNTTIGKKDTAEIIYPIKHKLLPEFTKLWSNKIKDDVQKVSHDRSVCFESGPLSRGCADYLNLFYSNFDDMVFTENGIIAIFVVILIIFFVPTCWLIRYKCIKPILAALLYFNNDDRSTPFHCVNGIPLRKLRPCRRNRRNGTTHINQQPPQFQIYLSYDEENEYDLMIAEHIKGKLLSMNISVFDFQTDVLPGHLVLTEIENAIVNSSRFVVITSESYVEHKGVEFNAIQDTIVGQGSRLRDRLLIIKSEDCDIERLYLVPCITIPDDLRARDALDDKIVGQFLKWEKSTKPYDDIFQYNKSDSIVGLLINRQIILALLIFVCFVVIIAIWFVRIGMK